jgi:hypothetical protein
MGKICHKKVILNHYRGLAVKVLPSWVPGFGGVLAYDAGE